MAGQGPTRRETIRILAVAATVAQFPGFSRWAFAQEHAHDAPVTPRPAHYTPVFFAPEDYRLLARLTELIIPTDETPGAKEAGVSEFIDFMAWSDPAIQDRFRQGVAWMNAQRFLSMADPEQQALLERLAYKQRHRAGEEEGQKFFALLREYTVMGYYTTRIGLEQLDYPGFRIYSESPGCTHQDRHA